MNSVLLYDADCGFCTRTAQWLQARLDRQGDEGRTEVSSMYSVDLAELGIDEARAKSEVPFRHADGRVTWGSAAIADALAACRTPWRWAGIAMRPAPIQLFARPIYVLIAQNRYRLPGGTAACALPR